MLASDTVLTTDCADFARAGIVDALAGLTSGTITSCLQKHYMQCSTNGE